MAAIPVTDQAEWEAAKHAPELAEQWIQLMEASGCQYPEDSWEATAEQLGIHQLSETVQNLVILYVQTYWVAGKVFAQAVGRTVSLETGVARRNHRHDTYNVVAQGGAVAFGPGSSATVIRY